nr:MAG TPA: hypothetical protein [Caudoviricetes sp.]
MSHFLSHPQKRHTQHSHETFQIPTPRPRPSLRSPITNVVCSPIHYTRVIIGRDTYFCV